MDEADSSAGRISWVSPVARALLGAEVGDLVRLRTPQGVESIEIVAIRYPDALNAGNAALNDRPALALAVP